MGGRMFVKFPQTICIHYNGIIGAAIGTLIPNIILALVYNIPVALKYSATNIKTYIKEYLIPLFISFSFTIYIGYLLVIIISPDSLIKLFINGLILISIFSLLYSILSFRQELKKYFKFN
jgi:hypothetical protein